MSVSLLEQKCLSQTLRREIWPRSKTITYTRLKKKETSHHDFSSCKWTAALQSPYNMWVASDFCACMVWESGLRGPSPHIIKAKCREVQALTGFGEYDSPPQVINCDTPPWSLHLCRAPQSLWWLLTLRATRRIPKIHSDACLIPNTVLQEQNPCARSFPCYHSGSSCFSVCLLMRYAGATQPLPTTDQPGCAAGSSCLLPRQAFWPAWKNTGLVSCHR